MGIIIPQKQVKLLINNLTNKIALDSVINKHFPGTMKGGEV
jgi:hypothetical protein